MMKYQLKKLSVIITLLFSSAHCIDLPNFWRASLFQGEPGNNIKDFSTYIDIKGSAGDATTGYDRSGDTKNILNIHGLIDVNKLAINVKNLTTAQKPTTFTWLRETSGTIPAYNFTGDNGKIELNGKISTHEIAIELRQNLFSGFYGKLHIPFRRVKLKNITITNKTDSSNSNATEFQTFLDDNLDTVLQENGLEALTTPYFNSTVGDLAVIAGWQGYGSDCFDSILKNLTGGVQAMITIPTASKQQLNRVVAIPMSYNNHWGIGARANALGHVSDWLAVGANMGVNVLLTRTSTQRMKTEKDQSGILLLDQGRAEVDPGTIWDIGGYIKLDKPFGGLYAIAGYGFTTQEPTRYAVKDSTFLSNVGSTENKSEIVNVDSRLEQWDQHVVHFIGGYDFKAHTDSNFAPLLEFFYSHPIFGKRTWKTNMVGGRGALTFSWNL